MPLPTDRTFDPPFPAEGTKYDPDATYTWPSSASVYTYWGVVATDGSRELIGRAITTRHAEIPTNYPGHDAFLIHRSNQEAHGFREGRDDPYWLNYDWTLSRERVNQWGYLPEWRADVARFCHSFDGLPGQESFLQLSAAAKTTAFQVGQTIGGHAWERLAFWLTYDASLSDDWKLPIVFDPVEKARDAVCAECQSKDAALLLAKSINPTTFAAKLAAGRIHGTDRSASVWEPGEILTVVPEPSEEVTVQTAIAVLASAFGGAQDYYLKHVAHVVTAHDHA